MKNPQEIAGMKVGDKCAAAIRAAVLQPREEVTHTQDPRQSDMFDPQRALELIEATA